MRKNSNGVGIWMAALLLILLAVTTFSRSAPPVSPYKYTEVVGFFQKGQVQEYVLDLDKGELHISELRGEPADITYKIPNMTLFLRDTQDSILEYNKENPLQPIRGDILPAKELPWWVNMMPMALLILMLVALWVFMIRQSRGGGAGGALDFGRAKTRNAKEGRKVTFADVAGADEEKEELVEIVEFLRAPAKYTTLGARIPKGVMLVGPPGTGKTLLARAVAGEADVEFFSISGSDFVEMFVGVGASRVRDLFNQAKKHAPSVIFIDEIDAVGRQRGTGLGGGHDEREQTLNQLLVEMDGFSTNAGVILIAATNRADILDPALLRPGRFDRQVYVGYPDIKGREEILKIHSRNKPLGPDVDLSVIAKTTIGFTGADLENLMNESALLAARRDLKAITMDEVRESSIKVQMGPEKKSKVVTEKDRKMTAYHEAGHAVASYYCPTQDPVHQVSIIPRGAAGGYTMYQPQNDGNYHSKVEMFENIVSCMGGRIAEDIYCGDVSTGASGDIRQATKIVRSMVMRYGFSEAVGPIAYGSDPGQVFLGRDYSAGSDHSEETAALIDREVRRIIEEAYSKCEAILKEHWDQLDHLAKELLQREKIEADEFKRLMETGSVDPLPMDPQPAF